MVSEREQRPASPKSQIEGVVTMDEIPVKKQEVNDEVSVGPSKPEVRVANRRKSRALAQAENETLLPLPLSPSVHSKSPESEMSKPASNEAIEPQVESCDLAATSSVMNEPCIAPLSSRPVPQDVLQEMNTETTAIISPIASAVAAASATKENDTSAATTFTGFSQEMREKRSEALGAKRKFVGRAPTSSAMYDSAGHRITGATPTSVKTVGKKKDRMNTFSVQKSSTPSTEVRPFKLSSSNRSQNAQVAPLSARAALEKKPHAHVKATKTSQLREQRLAKVKQDQKNNRKVPSCIRYFLVMHFNHFMNKRSYGHVTLIPILYLFLAYR